jgi:hypothetical protein
MEQIIEYEALERKTISRVVWLDMDRVFFIFNDDSFCIIKGSGWEEPYAEIDTNEYNLEPYEWNYNDLYKLGFISKEEYKKIANNAKDMHRKRIEEADLEKINILKQKYPQYFK